ncbi:DNA polymerase III subunit delta' [Flagellatimonas centrodinii]|uniref:DNA polymerase III subunit delta' n=1 Tax=Flagellatimonas centrodinii TaxID=2806210 RepID=UPI001FEF1D90|nr:DNA polymerase III subunit delta' [Flagellatimonas centrodinii]ULQ46261.1 DNA polymerase III subunit delta' [Flagellatimonas centrodinii]
MSDLQPLPWQAPLLSTLRQQQAAGQLGHALLITGPAGVGKRHLAHALVAASLCEQGGDSACGTCPACARLAAGSHPDRQWLQRRADDKTGKLRRDISIEQIREMIERVMLSAQYGRGKFVLIDPVDALNGAGRNALLKTLEEPPAETVLLLISERPLELPATVRSRCRQLRLAPPPAAEAAQWLSRQGHDAQLLPWAGGAPLQAAAWSESQQGAHFQRWAQGLTAIARGRTEPLALAAEIGRDEVAGFVEWLIRWLHAELRRALTNETSVVPAAWLEPVVVEALAARGQLAGNVNPQMVLESLLILWWRQARLAARGVQSR